MSKDDKPLPESSASKDGATTGAMGDATKADLDRGYTAVRENHRHEFLQPLRTLTAGFLGRSGGWER
jgi:hypothetical protein